MSSSLLPAKPECTYTRFYCEENVWHLADHVRRKNPALLQHCYAVFISNDERLTPLWKQTKPDNNKGGEDDDGFVLWDYHVIFVYRAPEGLEVFDLDNDLPFPCPMARYAREALHPETDFKPEFRRKFRVVPALEFVTTFASDRSHMRLEDGGWMKAPPAYPAIKTQKSSNNLDTFLVMNLKSASFGRLLDLQRSLS